MKGEDTLTRRLYSISTFAQKACVSLRTLRYYDAVGLLSPSQHTEAGYRLYSEEDLLTLQHILALKYLGFSLGEIRQCLKREPQQLETTLARQKAMLRDKRLQLDAILKAIAHVETLLQTGDCTREAIVRVIETIQMEQTKDWAKKYFSDAQLQKMEELSQSSYSPEARAEINRRTWTEADQERVNVQWAYLASESQKLAEAGVGPGAEEAQALAHLKHELLFGFTQGDPDVEAGLKKFWDSHNALPKAEQPLASVVPAINDAGSRLLDEAMTIYNERRNKPKDAL